MKKLLLVALLVSVLACDDILEVENISDDTITLLAPAEGVTVNSTTLTLSWNGMEGAESYHLQIAKPTFEAAQQIVKDTTLINTNILVTLENGSFQWRVQGVNSAYQSAFTTNSFTIEE